LGRVPAEEARQLARRRAFPHRVPQLGLAQRACTQASKSSRRRLIQQHRPQAILPPPPRLPLILQRRPGLRVSLRRAAAHHRRVRPEPPTRPPAPLRKDPRRQLLTSRAFSPRQKPQIPKMSPPARKRKACASWSPGKPADYPLLTTVATLYLVLVDRPARGC
jgi:hypothetical protein